MRNETTTKAASVNLQSRHWRGVFALGLVLGTAVVSSAVFFGVLLGYFRLQIDAPWFVSVLFSMAKSVVCARIG